MDFMTLQTRAGPLGVVGRVHTGPRRPALLAVNGSFRQKDNRHDLIDRFGGASVLVVNLPGMAGTPWANPTIAELTEGLEETVRRLLGDVPIVAFGASTSNLVTLGLRLPNICRRIALEPFFQTRDLWPFLPFSRARMANNPDNPALARFFWDVFGIGPDRLENRDYRGLLANITQPTDVIVGGSPLEPERELDFWPSFTSADDRAALRANPLVTLHEGPPDSGHGYGSAGPADLMVKRLLHAALREAAKLCG
jgi:pimeloyl-ACP methyl ester carboxylesterase